MTMSKKHGDKKRGAGIETETPAFARTMTTRGQRSRLAYYTFQNYPPNLEMFPTNTTNNSSYAVYFRRS
jgi:hypothetical protein